jgi:hypothetical protein
VRNLIRRSTLALTAATFLLSVSPFARSAAAADADPPPPGVARIDLIQGDVGVRHDDAGETVAAVVNAPLLDGDYITTGDAGSGAEVQLDGATLVRVGYDTQLRFTKADSGDRVAQLAQGTIEERVLDGGTPTEIDTPSISIRPLGSGGYRVAVADDGSSQITIRSGNVQLMTPQGPQSVSAGHSVNVSGNADQPAIEVVDAIAKDDFDAFNDARDAAAKQAVADPNLPPDLAYDDYSRYGQWVQDPTYGEVWAPTVDPSWAPYTNGAWAWEGGYGWTWISYDPWGWGPYHYGRWFHSVAYGWCWYPPQRAPIYVWSPALVAFVGFGGPSVVGFASIGWVPLGPREPFYPWYGYSGGVFAASTSVRVVDVASVTFVNRRWGRMVPIDHWQAGNFAHPVRIAKTDWENVQVVHGALPVVPTRANLRFVDRPVAAKLARAPVVRPRFVALAPAHRTTTSFDQVRNTLQTHVQTFQRTPANEGRAPATQLGAPANQSGKASNEGGRLSTQGDAWDRYQRARGTVPVNDGSRGRVPVIDGSNGSRSAPASTTTQHGFTSARPPAGNTGTGAGSGSGYRRNVPAQSPNQQHAPPPPPRKTAPAPKKDADKKP